MREEVGPTFVIGLHSSFSFLFCGGRGGCFLIIVVVFPAKSAGGGGSVQREYTGLKSKCKVKCAQRLRRVVHAQ